ncbi:DUF72 domain-containing protein [Pedobacter heparinus]|uniref:DUF72 domain-containing protein n=1 Tax=Pedobacter heparinus (strain ATCC 13125 / DSM 2366 / CIP 104194 / JCM 7457 / NBRC 12017 / NCIMB 9290 / NRRL B-14731 / HIM 762-3) TaxID=485917 RepID=C6Y1Y5_PEDHD|nr:DUF72 domain-containing protein [Pedobacter heparinus]ACU05127.1 protein of unknown function DUF72 [Pedobacter heparinus DSM 2366]
MDFGKVAATAIAGVDFALPPDGKQTAMTLKGLKPVKSPDFYIGCAKWGRKEWVNMIYPPKTKEADFLDEYVKHFNSIELNAVFYSIPNAELIRKWRIKAEENSGNGFVFCPKFSRTISHIKRLKDAEVPTDLYLSGISEFGKFLGPCFLQLGDNFGPKNFEVLENYLKQLPKDLEVFVELRHEEWFSDAEMRARLFDMLAGLKKGAVITDASGRRDCVHMELTIPEIFIRFVGNGQEFAASDFARIDDWTARIKTWLDKGLKKVYFFLHQHDEKDTPILADYTIQQFNQHLGAKVAAINFIDKPKEITKQRELF